MPYIKKNAPESLHRKWLVSEVKRDAVVVRGFNTPQLGKDDR
jgi:hypothetical protein